MTTEDDVDAQARAVRRTWLRICLIASGCVLALVVSGMAIASGIDALWREALEHAVSLAKRLPQTQARRLCLWGQTESGNAWDSYHAALRAIDTDPVDERAAARLLAAPSQLDRREREALLHQAAPALDLLRAGAHRELALTTLPTQSPRENPLSRALHVPGGRLRGRAEPSAQVDADPTAAVRRLTAVARLRAEHLSERNDADGAVQQLLDVLQFARDLVATPRWREEALAANEGLRIVRLPSPALSALDLGLADLDAGLPARSHANLGDAVDLVLRLDHDPVLADELAVRAFGAWRYGCSARAMAARYLEHIDQHARDAAEAHAHPGPDLLADLLRLRGRLDSSSNPLTRRVAIEGQGDPRRRLHALVRLRLLRLAAQFRQGRTPGPMPDPAGGVLTTALIEGRFRVGSRHAGAPNLTVAGTR
jgi:hypothetical protein